VCISWKIKCWILFMHGVIMKFKILLNSKLLNSRYDFNSKQNVRFEVFTEVIVTALCS